MPGYEVKVESLSIGDHNIQVRSLKDKQQFSDPDGVAERKGISSATWPIFGVVWPSSIILARVMQSLPLGNLKLLEVGCGLAVAGMVASQEGATVTVSDYHPLAEAFLDKNKLLNTLPDIAFLDGDWRTPITGAGTFDIIIGSDLLYEREHPQLLATFIHCHAAANAKVIIVDPGRKLANRFSRHMAELGWQNSVETLLSDVVQDEKYSGKVFTYTRKPLDA
jgi:predicted nicotinamide N-methyase